MHRNPVTRGLVAKPDQWRWSSFRSYAYGEVDLVKINRWEVLKMKVRVSGVWFSFRRPGPTSRKPRDARHAL